MPGDLTNHVSELLRILQKLIKTRVDLLKLSVIEKSSGFASFIFSTLFAVLIATLAMGFGAAAFAVWYGETCNNYIVGLLLAAGLLLIVAIIFFFICRKLFVSFVIKNFSEILFKEEEKQEI